VLALVAVLLVLASPLASQAARTSRTLPGPPRDQPEFSRDEARELLAEARSRMRRDSRPHDRGNPVGHGEATEITMTLRDLFLARPALTGPEREAADTLLSRPTDIDGDDIGAGTAVAFPAAGRERWCPAGGVACVHWMTAGADRVSTSDTDGDQVPNYVETVNATIEDVWAEEVDDLGYRAPLSDGGEAADSDNPTPGVDIYLADLGSRGLYGYCAPEGPPGSSRLPGYCVLDNDYATGQYGIAWVDALRVTVAHEFFHLVQFAYDVDEDTWFMEGTATWIEDEVFDGINDNLQFLADSPLRHPRTPVDYSSGLHRYGAWLFFRFVSERLDRQLVRQFWEGAAAGTTYSLQAIRAAVATRMSWPTFMTVFGAWNTLPANSYSERATYPSPAWTLQQTLSSTSTSTGWRTVNLPHLSSSAIRVTPHSRLSTSKRLEVRVDAPNTSQGSSALLQRRLRDGRVLNSTITLDKYGNGRVVYAFNRTSISSIVVVVANTSTAMQSCGQVLNSDGPIYSCAGRGVHDSNQPYKVLARLL
jgi:hypothetical protein